MGYKDIWKQHFTTILSWTIVRCFEFPGVHNASGLFLPSTFCSVFLPHGIASYLLQEDTPHASLDHVHLFFTLIFLCLPLSFTLFTKLFTIYPSPYSLSPQRQKLWLICLHIPSAYYMLSTQITQHSWARWWGSTRY